MGPGNNSNLTKGIIKRRRWWVLTERIDDASLVWTQLKLPFLFKNQRKGLKLPSLNEDSPNNSGTTESLNLLFNSIELAKW